MILVDTSIWIEYFHLKNQKLYLDLRQRLEEDQLCISVVTRIELLAGISKKQQTKFLNALNVVTTYYPDLKDWRMIESWTEHAKKDGFHFQISDLMIASTAQKNTCEIYTLDSDFKRMEKYGWIRLFQP